MNGSLTLADRIALPQARLLERNTLIYRPSAKANPRVRLFCFPYAGAGGTIFRLWPNYLEDDVEVVSLHPPGRAHRLREPPFRRVEAMVESAIESFSDLLDRPFAVFGHSLGAIVGAEFARIMSLSSRPPGHLFVSSRPPIPQKTRLLHEMEDAAFLVAINERYQGIPRELLAHEDLLQLLLPALRADVEALETFDYGGSAKIQCPTSVYGGEVDPTVSLADLEAWHAEVSAPCDVRVFAGDHFYLNTQTKALLTDISAKLKRL